ncbi:hypothetical protein D3C80_941830 [compost metagenome]
MAAERRTNRRTYRDTATGHAFTNVVVGVAGQGQFNPTRIPDAEALAGGTGEVRLDRVGSHALIAVHGCDSPGQGSAHRTVGIADIEVESLALSGFDMRLRLRQQILVHRPLVERRVAAFGAIQRLARMRRGGFQQRRQIQLVLLGGDTVQFGQEIGTTNQIHQLANP